MIRFSGFSSPSETVILPGIGLNSQYAFMNYFSSMQPGAVLQVKSTMSLDGAGVRAYFFFSKLNANK